VEHQGQWDSEGGYQAASNALLDRGYGKPVAPIEMDHHVNEFDGMTEEELGEYIGEKMSELGIKIEEA
jgi:hypothetical protein